MGPDIEVTTYADRAAASGSAGPASPGQDRVQIDVPALAAVKAGKVSVAGVAWAQHKGIEAVRSRWTTDPWQEASLAAVPDLDTWRQWVWEWARPTPGKSHVEARATDKTGYTQTSVQTPEAPNGASGYPVAQVSVS